MFGLLNCTRFFDTDSGPRVIFNDLNFVMNYHDRVGILAAQGSGKTSLARLLCHIDLPDDGKVLGQRGEAILLGSNSFLLPGLTGEENARLIAGFYGVNGDEFSHFCYQLTALGARYTDKVNEYSITMKAHLAFSINLLLPCRLYIADDKLYTGDTVSQKRMHYALSHELEKKGLVLLTRNPRLIKESCNRFGVLLNGKVIMCQNLRQASSLFNTHQSPESMNDGDDSSFDV